MSKLNIPWTETHEALLEQQITSVRDKMQYYAGRMTRGTADTEDIDAHEFYTGFLNVLVSMRQPVTSRTLVDAFIVKAPTKDEVWSEPFPSLTKFDKPKVEQGPTLIVISSGRDKQEPLRMARELAIFQAAHGITNPITIEQVESAHAMDVRCGNYEHERAWDVFADMIATASRRVPKPDGDINSYAIDWHPDDPTTLIYAPESFWDNNGAES